MSEHQALALIVAVARNGVIGKDGGLPWHIPEDLKHFKKITMGHALIMGRTTHASIGGPLPGRRNIVVTSRPDAVHKDCEAARSLEEALTKAYETDTMPFVLGGAQLYTAALPLVTHIYWTMIDRDIAGDTHFPAFDKNQFTETENRIGSAPDISYQIWVRRSWLAQHPQKTAARD